MIPTDFNETAQAYHLLSNLEPKHLNQLLPLAKDALFNRDQIIFSEGERSEFLYLIIAGSVALETIAAGRPIRVQTLNAGDATGWSSVIESSRTHFQARALTQVSAIALRGEELRAACERDPALGYAFFKELLGLVTERLDATRMQLVDMYSANVRPGAAGA
jgi:CRP/FNR family transcriptional regulator, cyclic AMP receptor protein